MDADGVSRAVNIPVGEGVTGVCSLPVANPGSGLLGQLVAVGTQQEIHCSASKAAGRFSCEARHGRCIDKSSGFDHEVPDRPKLLAVVEVRDIEEEELVQRLIAAGLANAAAGAARWFATDERHESRAGDGVSEVIGGFDTGRTQRGRCGNEARTEGVRWFGDRSGGLGRSVPVSYGARLSSTPGHEALTWWTPLAASGRPSDALVGRTPRSSDGGVASSRRRATRHLLAARDQQPSA